METQRKPHAHFGPRPWSLTRTLVFLEDRYGVKIPDEEVVLDEVSTLEKFARFAHERIVKG